MKCLVCNKELNGNICERCGFPKIVVVGGAEDDPVVKTAVHDFKDNILKKITIEMETYQYKEDGSKLVLAQTDRIPVEHSYRILRRISVPGSRRTLQEWKPAKI